MLWFYSFVLHLGYLAVAELPRCTSESSINTWTLPHMCTWAFYTQTLSKNQFRHPQNVHWVFQSWHGMDWIKMRHLQRSPGFIPPVHNIYPSQSLHSFDRSKFLKLWEATARALRDQVKLWSFGDDCSDQGQKQERFKFPALEKGNSCTQNKFTRSREKTCTHGGITAPEYTNILTALLMKLWHVQNRGVGKNNTAMWWSTW